MSRLVPWVVVLVLASVVVVFYVKYVHGRGQQPRPPTENQAAETVDGSRNDDTRDQETVSERPDPAQNDEGAQEEPDETKGPAAPELFIEAVKAQEAGDARAIELYREVIRIAPKSEVGIQAAARLGNHYYGQREAGKAIQYLKIALSGKLAAEQREKLTAKLDELSAGLIFDPERNPRASYYIVKRGDSLSKIAQKYQVPWRLLMRLNRLKNTKIRIDDRLKVVRGPFDAVVERSRYKLSVYLGNKYVKSYGVGLGRDNSTPSGTFKVTSKLENPDWYRPGKIIRFGDPENILGTRWIGFMKGYGIHGTAEPETIGSQSSEGCIRMLNKDVEELFDLLIQGKSKITIKK